MAAWQPTNHIDTKASLLMSPCAAVSAVLNQRGCVGAGRERGGLEYYVASLIEFRFDGNRTKGNF